MSSSLTGLTDKELVERVPTDAPGDRIWQQAPYLLEMQRRQIEATREFSHAADKQAKVMIRLTGWIVALTVLLLLLTVMLVWKEWFH